MKLPTFRSKSRKAEASRPRILLWAVAWGLIFGAVEAGEPLENSLREGRNALHRQSASGEIVIVGIDNRSIAEVNKWPWPRRHHARIAAELQRAGARRIFFDLDLSSASNPVDDKILEAQFAAMKGKVTVPVHFTLAPLTDERTDLLPLPAFRKHVELANINLWYDAAGNVWDMPYAMVIGGKSYPSFAAALARVAGDAGDTFPIDYSIDPRSIPVISAVDVMGPKRLADQVAGKDVVVGTISRQAGDVYLLPGHGQMPGVFLHAIAAETLNAGIPIELGWFMPFAVALALAACCLLIRNLRVAMGALAGTIAGLLIVPLALEQNRMFADITPALFLLLIVEGRLAWKIWRQAYQARGVTNTVSGLPNLNALREEALEQRGALVAVRIHNYPEIASTLSAEEEKALVEQIANRLNLGTAAAKLFHGDEGIFAWLTDQSAAGSIGGQLDALHALFRSPVAVANRQVDLTVTFGVDAGSERSLANRLGSALVAADEAAGEGLRWKLYDPGKLKDAEWKLSLLSQLDAAIEAGDLWIAFQPKLDLASRTIVGAEALVRWTHPTKGAINPVEFIVAAEQSQRIEKLTLYVLERAIVAAASINERGMTFTIAVNLSARLIGNAGIVAAVIALLAKHKLPAERLTLEVTETAALATSADHLQTLQQLRATGVQISIDDYGTGLSTLDYLKKIPATEIKIDKSFVQAIDKSRGDRLMVHSTIQLAHSLGHKVVAEGVEDADTLDALVAMGCDMAQGFLIGRPVPLNAFTKQLLESRKAA